MGDLALHFQIMAKRARAGKLYDMIVGVMYGYYG